MVTPTGVSDHFLQDDGYKGAIATDASCAAANSALETVSSTATAGDAVTAPLLEMRIDYGTKGTGDAYNEPYVNGFVESILASTGGGCVGFVVTGGGFGSTRDDRGHE